MIAKKTNRLLALLLSLVMLVGVIPFTVSATEPEEAQMVFEKGWHSGAGYVEKYVFVAYDSINDKYYAMSSETAKYQNSVSDDISFYNINDRDALSTYMQSALGAEIVSGEDDIISFPESNEKIAVMTATTSNGYNTKYHMFSVGSKLLTALTYNYRYSKSSGGYGYEELPNLKFYESDSIPTYTYSFARGDKSGYNEIANNFARVNATVNSELYGSVSNSTYGTEFQSPNYHGAILLIKKNNNYYFNHYNMIKDSYYYDDESTPVAVATVYTQVCQHKNMVEHPGTAAKIGSDGTLTYYSCPDCAGYYSDEAATEQISEYDIPPAAHYLEKIEVRPASCTEYGITKSYYKCVNCKNIFEDENGTTQIWNEQELLQPATGHRDNNTDLICDICNQTIMPLEFKKVTDTSDIIADGTYILVDENGKIMGKPVPSSGKDGKDGKDETDNSLIPSVSVTANAKNRYNYYLCKAAGAMIFNLRHICNYQEWGTDVSMIYGMHYDGLGLEFSGDAFYSSNALYSKYGMRFILKDGNFIKIDSHYNLHWNEAGTDNIFFRSFTDGKGVTVFAVKPDADGTENKVYLYRMVSCYSVSSTEGSVSAEVADKKSDTVFSVTDPDFDMAAASGGTNVTGITEALSGDYLNGILSDYVTENDIAADTTIKVDARVDVAVSEYKKGESITFSLTPKLSISDSSSTDTITINDENFSGTAPMTVILYTGGIPTETVIHHKQDGTNEYFYPKYSEQVLNNGEKAFTTLYDANGEEYISISVTEFSEITLCVAPSIDASISLGSDITVNCYAKIYDFDSTVKMEFTMNDKLVTVKGTATEVANEYVFRFTGVAPQYMDETISAVLKKGDTVLYEKPDFSIKSYCDSLLGFTFADDDKDGKDDTTGYTADKFDAMQTLVKDLLIYGGAAQTYIGYKPDELVSNGITGSVFPAEGLTVTDKLYSNNIGSTRFTGMNVWFDNVNKLIARFTTNDIGSISVGIKAGDKEEVRYTEFNSLGENQYTVLSEAIEATAFDTVYTITLYVNNVAGASATYSVNSYVFAMQNSANSNLQALVKATYNYGQSADTFNK